jgi:hypothetical protein
LARLLCREVGGGAKCSTQQAQHEILSCVHTFQ